MIPMPPNLLYKNAEHLLIDDINKLIEEAHVPFWMLELILKDIFNEIKTHSAQEYKLAEKQYNEALAKEVSHKEEDAE
jgi:hypothetical protein